MRESIKKMAKITILNDDAVNHRLTADMIVTDPPFEMSGKQINDIISQYNSNHLLLICSLRQLIEFAQATDYKMGFDFVLDFVAPKQSKSQQQPNYIHAHAVYFYKSKSVFNRRHGERSDVFTKGYCPTIIKASRERNNEHGMAKNVTAIKDMLSFFDIESVIDMFCGSGTTGLACLELDIDCTLIEKDPEHFSKMKQTFEFLGVI